MILRIAFICQTAIALTVIALLLAGCAANPDPGSPCAGYFFCTN